MKRLFEIQEFTAALHAANGGFASATETQTKQVHAVLMHGLFVPVKSIR
jgi:hypothetical protein